MFSHFKFNHSHKNHVYCIAYHNFSKYPMISVIFTANYDDLKTGHIHHQQLQINKNQLFVFQFSQIQCLTAFPLFSAAILERRYKPRMLVCKPIQNNKLQILRDIFPNPVFGGCRNPLTRSQESYNTIVGKLRETIGTSIFKQQDLSRTNNFSKNYDNQ